VGDEVANYLGHVGIIEDGMHEGSDDESDMHSMSCLARSEKVIRTIGHYPWPKDIAASLAYRVEQQELRRKRRHRGHRRNRNVGIAEG
jgi:hypothetical protein